MKKIRSYAVVTMALLSLLFTMTSSTKTFTIFMIGDSTMANKDIKKGPERGWGMALQGFFTENVIVDNHALNGRSSRSFILEGHWQKVYDAMKPGDYLVIQFGHNDEKGHIGDKRHTDPGLTLDDNYRMFARAAQEKGATPIIMNAVVRRNFYSHSDQSIDDEKLRDMKANGKEIVNSDTLIETHVTKDGNYVTAPLHVAKMMRVPFVDANKITKDFENKLGVEKSRLLHMISVNGKDNTHYNIYGAHEIASLLVDAMAAVCPELKPFVRHYDYIVSAKGKGNYMTLQEAIDAVPAKKAATISVIDGTFPKPNTNGKNIRIVKYSNVKIR
ncbi:MAG: rhamnogalacturonan acetylesterase [Prevotella sp.]|nr:rhamnogalacturonan acetylesterase [Candidatus Prevotella equi]